MSTVERHRMSGRDIALITKGKKVKKQQQSLSLILLRNFFFSNVFLRLSIQSVAKMHGFTMIEWMKKTMFSYGQ